jgi:hypothetical protein
MHTPPPHAAHAACDVYDAPPSENVPAAHGFAVSDAVPAGQKWPAGHGACILFVDTAVRHTYPAKHSAAELDELPVARHAPRGHGRHVALDVNATPPFEYVLAGQAFVAFTATPMPGGQK